MIQKTLAFDPPAKLSRKSDKLTSQKSAAETEKQLPKKKQAVIDVMQMTPEPMTAQEIARAAQKVYGGIADTYRKRPHELVVDQMATEAGERKCEVTGKLATTYKLKEQQ